MSLANRMLSRDGFTLNPQVQHSAAPAAQRVRSGTQLCSSAGWVQHVGYSRQHGSNLNKSFRPILQRRWTALTGAGWYLYVHLSDICKVLFSNFTFLSTPNTSAHFLKKKKSHFKFGIQRFFFTHRGKKKSIICLFFLLQPLLPKTLFVLRPRYW